MPANPPRAPGELAEIEYTAEELARCKAAMSKPAPLEALRLIASGRLIVELSRDRRDVLIDQVDGRMVRDGAPDRKMFLGGAWPLYRAGMISAFGVVTEEGRRDLARSTKIEGAGEL